MPSQAEITHLLQAWSNGDPDALAALMPLVVDDLRRMAGACFRHESQAHTLQPTALVNEAYLRMSNGKRPVWRNRREFFAFASTLMRNILVDHARSRRASKRGGDVVHVPLQASMALTLNPDIDVLALDQALTELEAIDPRQAEIVRLRHFFGLEIVEVAEVLEISISTVKREWRSACFRLASRLAPAAEGSATDSS